MMSVGPSRGRKGEGLKLASISTVAHCGTFVRRKKEYCCQVVEYVQLMLLIGIRRVATFLQRISQRTRKTKMGFDG